MKRKITENKELSAEMQALGPQEGIVEMMRALHDALEKTEDGAIGMAVLSYHRAEGMVGLHGMIFKRAEIEQMAQGCDVWKQFAATFTPGKEAHKIVAEQRAARGEAVN